MHSENRQDSAWLRAALNKGTVQDRAKAGALLVASNPEGNLDTLETLIGFTRSTQKFNSHVLMTLVELWIESLMPHTRRLRDLDMRSKFWSDMRRMKLPDPDGVQRRMMAYWYFENALKDKYEGKCLDFVKMILITI